MNKSLSQCIQMVKEEIQCFGFIEQNNCGSTKTQVNPDSALKRPKHHQSDQSIVPGIPGSSLP